MAVFDVNGRSPGNSFFLNEGAFTRDDDMLTDQGPAKGGDYASKMSIGTEVQISTAKDKCVEPLSNGIAIGRIANRPEVKRLPKVNTAFANLTDDQIRIANVETDGVLIRVALDDSNQAISRGSPLGVKTALGGLYDKEEDTTTNVYSLQEVAANTGGFILAFKKGVSQKVAD